MQQPRARGHGTPLLENQPVAVSPAPGLHERAVGAVAQSRRFSPFSRAHTSAASSRTKKPAESGRGSQPHPGNPCSGYRTPGGWVADGKRKRVWRPAPVFAGVRRLSPAKVGKVPHEKNSCGLTDISDFFSRRVGRVSSDRAMAGRASRTLTPATAGRSRDPDAGAPRRVLAADGEGPRRVPRQASSPVQECRTIIGGRGRRLPLRPRTREGRDMRSAALAPSRGL
jgi:hypothetical protein